MLTPFALGTVAGAIATGRVPVGNAKGSLVTSRLNPTSVILRMLGVATSSYLATVYLAADARRQHKPGLERNFGRRALHSGVAAGALAVAALAVIRVACLLLGASLTVLVDAGWAQAVGISCLFACAIVTFIPTATTVGRAR
jgi:cytochrome d ubiquinol oxidase subunit II